MFFQRWQLKKYTKHAHIIIQVVYESVQCKNDMPRHITIFDFTSWL